MVVPFAHIGGDAFLPSDADQDRHESHRATAADVDKMSAGLRCIDSTPRSSTGSRWSVAPQEPPFHAAAEEGVSFKKIAEVIGRRLNIPVVSKSPEEATERFGWFAMFAGFNVPTSSERTMLLVGSTEQPGLIADIDHPAYFA